VSVANYKIGLNSGIFWDFDTMPACTTALSFSFIRLSTGWSKNFDVYEIELDDGGRGPSGPDRCVTPRYIREKSTS
jgi:hypothetical protein